MNVLDRLDAAVIVVRRRGEQRDALCPAHPDQSSSLTYGPGDAGGAVLTCHAGCDTASICTAVGINLRDLMGEPFIEATYPYTTADGHLLWEVQRWANPKDFRVSPGLPPAGDRVLFAMPWVNFARQNNQPVYVVEGEKDATRLLGMGIPATCNVGGAGRGKWLPQYSAALKGCQVVVVADNDEAGRRHARAVADSLDRLAAQVIRVVPKFGSDVSDHLDAGFRLEQLEPLPELDTGALLVKPADIAITPVQWVWPGYVPRGALSIIDGDPGDGKSVMTLDLAARWTTGAPMPDGAPNPGPMNVVLVSAEDDPVVVATRLRAAGADLDRIHMLIGVRGVAGDERPFDLGTDLAILEDVLRTTKAGVVVLDPLMAFMGEEVDVYKDPAVRRQLLPFIDLVREYESALLVVRHLTKGGTKAIYKGGGSIAFVGAARSAFLVAREAQDPEVRVLANIKANLGARPAALRYRLVASPAYDAPVLEWMGPSASNAQQLIDSDPREASMLVEAMFFLRDYLTEAGPSTWPDVLRAARAAGMGGSDHTLRRAREEVGCTHRRSGYGESTRTLWELPADWGSMSEITHSEPAAETDQPVGATNTDENLRCPLVPTNGDTVSEGPLGNEDCGVVQLPACDVCSSTESVGRYDANPDLGWPDCTRCVAHNPYTYGGQQP